MRLLFVSLYFHPALRYGGPIASTWHLCRGLAAQGTSVRVVTTDADGPRRLATRAGFQELAPGVEVRYCRTVGRELFAPGMLPAVVAAAVRADSVYVSGLFVWPLPALSALCALLGRRLLIAPRGMLLPQALAAKAGKKRLFLAALKACGGRRALFHVTSQEEEESVRREIQGARVVRIPNGVELPSPLEAVARSPGAPPYLLFLGRIHPHKRIETILEAFALWAGHAGCELWIAGDGPAQYRESLAARAQELGVASRVRFLPPVDGAGKSRLLANARALVLASRSESFGMVVAEALAHRTPCVVTATAPWESLERERCGVWVREEGPRALADGFARLLDRPAAELREMGERGRAFMQRDFSWDRVAVRMAAALRPPPLPSPAGAGEGATTRLAGRSTGYFQGGLEARPILGINSFHADASAAILTGGQLLAAVEEERFTRVKHWAGFPERAIRHCLAEAGVGSLGEIAGIAVSRRPRAYLARKAALALAHPRSLGRALGRARNLRQVASLGERLGRALGGADPSPVRVHSVEHHLAHLASAFFCSPFEEAMCLSVDGFGDFVSTMLAVGRGGSLTVLDRVHFPHSLGLFYTAVTQHLGFPNFGDEYKVMGLAAYGEPRFAAALRLVVPARADGTFRLDLRYFRHLAEGVDMTWDDGEPRLGTVFTPALEALLGPARRPDEELTQRHKDLAASLQRVYEERFFALVRELGKRTGQKRLALAGGCAMNSLANGRLFQETDVREVFVQAAAGDAGTALGAALYLRHAVLGAPREFVMEHAYWGPAYDAAAVRSALASGLPGSGGADGTWRRDGETLIVATVEDADRLAEETADALVRGEIVGWYQGRSEWGPRALGNRSILADPRRPDVRDLLNRKIKRRELFRPFAPSILEERTGDWFTIDYPDPFMIKVYPIRPERRGEIPAVTHADGTGRLQTVSAATNPRYWRLIRAFEELTSVPIVLNTSFNESEPIVNRPEEALDCFLRTKMDRLVLGDRVVTREPAG